MAYPSGRSEYLHFEGSDHRPLVTSFDPKTKKRKCIFRYDRRLKDNDEVKKLVLDSWNSNLSATVDHRIFACRSSIILWSKQHHLNSQVEIFTLREQLEDEISSNSSPQEEIDSINTRLLSAYQREKAFWKQRSRNLWLALGDKNSGFFHAATKNRRAINNIAVIESSAGLPVYEEDEIVSAISDYYQQIFTYVPGDRITTVNAALKPCITTAMNEKLIMLPSPAEIKLACFSIHPDKAPGPNGFTASFFQSNWDTVCDKVISEVQAFFINRSCHRRSTIPMLNSYQRSQAPKKFLTADLLHYAQSIIR